MDIDSSQSTMRSIIHQVTAEKLQKLRTQKETLTTHFLPTLQKIEQQVGGDHLENLKLLQKVMVSCPIKNFQTNDAEEEAQLKELDVLISLAETDPSNVGTYDQILAYWVKELCGQIRFKLQRCDYSFLYGSVMREYLEVKKKTTLSTPPSLDAVDQGKDETIKELKDRIFQPSTIKGEAFREFLLEKVFNFEGFEEKKRFEDLKEQISETVAELARSVNEDDLKHCIKGLISVDLLSEEKKATLRELEQNSVALTELATLLTDYVANISTWNWPAPVKIDFRRNMAGKFRAFMDEDIITALFLQYIGVKWAIFFKSNMFTQMYKDKTLFKQGPSSPTINRRGGNTIILHREKMHKENFLSVLPSKMEDQYIVNTYDDNEGGAASRRKNKRDAYTPVDVKQRLLHIISNEIKLNLVIHPESPITIVQTDMEWFGPSLSHDAILVLMQVLGVPQEWTDFFRRFLQAPLLLEGDAQPRVRQRGVAISHLLTTLFGESLLFVMDLYMQKKSGIVLHRIHDDFWFWSSDQEQVVKAWEAIEEYTAAAGLTINKEKSGSILVPSGAEEKSIIFGKGGSLPQQQVRWGFLDLYSDGVFRINISKLDPHIEEMRRILAEAGTVVDWVNTYNKFMSFFLRNFGNCSLTFGTQHILQIIQALKYVTAQVFKDEESRGNPLNALRSKFALLGEREDVLDAWIYWPVQQGGLGLTNPALGMMCLLKTYENLALKTNLGFSLLPEEDKSVWKNMMKQSEEKKLKSKYKRPSVMEDQEMLTDSEFSDTYEDGGDGQGQGQGKRKRRYITFERLCKKSREYRWAHWGNKYERLLQCPEADAPKSGGNSEWLAAIYGPKLKEYFGTKDFINDKLIPVSLISMMKTSRVKY